jgi:hypothetical protein
VSGDLVAALRQLFYPDQIEWEAADAIEARDATIAALTADCAAWEVLHKRRMELIATLTDNLDATRFERDRLRTAGDALAEVVDDWPELVAAWQEARNA